MHTKTEQHQLIRYLKSKPRHGVFDLGALLAKSLTAATAFNGQLDVANKKSTQVATGLDKLAGANEVLLKRYRSLTEASLKLELQNKAINDSFGVTSTSAAKLSQEFHQVAKELGITGKQMMANAAGIKNIVPTLDQSAVKNKTYYKGLVAVQQVLTTNLKLTSAQAEEYSYYASQQGESAAMTLKATETLTGALDPSGTMGLFKVVTAGIAKAGATIQLQYGKIPGNLEMAVLKAHTLGLEMKDLQSISDNLLNIESSIGDELSYQLLTGRRLVGDEKAQLDLQGKSLTNAYRLAAFQRDGNKQADILNTILTQEGSQLETNLLARQQMSKLLGIDEMQLSRAIQKKKILEDSGAEILFNVEGDALIRQAKALVDTGKMKDDAFKELVKMQDTRTTDETLDQILQVNQESALTQMLIYDQLDVIGKVSGNVKKSAEEIKLVEYVKSEMESLGTVLMGKRIAEKTAQDLADEMAASSGGTGMQEAQVQGVNSVSSRDDALMINDGVVKFNPRDKFMRVNDSTMIAGTEVDGNRQLARSINDANSAMTSAQISQLVQTFTAVGNMMKDAIDSQTSALKRDNLFAPGINRGTWA